MPMSSLLASVKSVQLKRHRRAVAFLLQSVLVVAGVTAWRYFYFLNVMNI